MQGVAATVDVLPLVSTICQMFTALIAVSIGILTFRYTKRQNALTLINQNNALANAVNSTIIASAEARMVLGRLQDPIVGSPDDAVLFMYLNYVHNTFRMRRIGTVSREVWRDTADACVQNLRRLRRDQVERLLARGYEAAFQHAILRRFDRLMIVAANDALPMARVAANAA